MLKRFKKFMAFTLAAVMSTTNVLAYTAGTNGTGPGGSGQMDSLGFLIEIKSKVNDKSTMSPSHYLQDTYLANSANDLRQANVEQGLLIKVKDRQPLQSRNIYWEMGKEVASFKNVEVVNKDASGDLQSFIFDDLVKAYEGDTKITWEEYVAARDKGKTSAAHKSFVSIFGRPQDTATKLMKYLDDKATWGLNRGYPGYNRLAYLDVLSMINKMCGYKYDNIIRTFLDEYNNAKAQKWVYIQVSSIASFYPQGGAQHWYTPQGFYGEMFGNGPAAYSKTPSNRPHYPSSEDAFERSDITHYQDSIVKGKSAKSGYTKNVGIWGSYALGSRGTIWNTGNDFDFKYTSMPTSFDGKQIGNSGYTFLTTRYNDRDLRIGRGLPEFEIHIKSDPKGEKVPESGNGTSDVEFRVNFINDMARDSMKEFLDYYPKYKVEITINFYTRILEGSANQGTLIDSIEGLPADARVEKGTPSRVIIPVTKANIDGILSGTPFRFKDNLTGMSKEGVAVKYAADSQMNVITNDGVKFDQKIARAIGVEKDKAVVYDTTNWIPNPKEYRYISNLKESYVEIKEGNPGNEDFEAMAGVPTTRDLYVGFGGQEFEVQVEAGYEKEAASRTVTVSCSGQSTGEGKPCPSAGKPCPKHPQYDSEGKLTGYETHGGDACGGATCLSHPSYNVHHPGGYSATYTTNIPIDEYGYMDIKAAQGWLIDNAKLYGNPELFSNPDQIIDPDLRYAFMVTEEGYTSGNGRLGFKFNFDQGPSWGNITKSHDLGTSTTKSLNSSVNGIFSSHKGFTDEVTVFSDTVVLETSQGVQSVLYDSYKSRTVTDAGGTGYTGQALNFGNSGGSVSYGVKEGSAKFDKVPTADEIWNNKWSAGRLDADDMVTSGYNGKYSKPSNKWDHRKYPISGDPLDSFYWKDYGHPNSVQTFKAPRAPKLGFSNKDLTYAGLDIIDSTDSSGNWSDSDSIEPVYNGEWDTGETEINYINFMNFKMTTGKQYGPAFKRTPIYSDNHYEVNDIVVHNPVSAQQATVISNPNAWDMRTEESLSTGGDPTGPPGGFCPGEGSCTLSHLNCTAPFVQHSSSCYKEATGAVVHVGGNNTHVHDGNCSVGGVPENSSQNVSFPEGGGGTDLHNFVAKADGSIRMYSTSYSRDPRGRIYINGSLVVDNDDSGSNLNFDTGTFRFKKGDSIRTNVYSYSSGGSGSAYVTTTITYDNYCSGSNNTHTCTSACKPELYTTLTCTDAHHYEAGKPYNPLDPKLHHPMPDSRCWDPCLDDAKHNQKVDIIINGKPAKPGDIFINLDKPFQIYYPDIGNFAQSPGMHGIGETTDIRGMGYVDNMNTREWLRDKYVTFPVNVIDELGNPHPAGEPIDLLELPSSGDIYNFHCVLGNSEYSNATTTFLSIGNNAIEEKYYDESVGVTNRDRVAYKYGAMHTASKDQFIDVVGFIGNLTINDTGDFRYASLFKKPLNNGKWLVDNLVPEVDMKSPNFVVSDDVNILQDKANAANKYHSPYNVTNAITGGKAHPYVSLPLTPKDNPIPALRNKPMRPGYNLFMDVETIGNYYGENFAEVNGSDVFTPVDNDMYYKVQVTPRYFELDLDTKQYKPVDVYMGTDGNYRLIISHNDLGMTTEWLYYLNWLEESTRRNYTAKEKDTSYDVQSQYGNNILVTGVRLPQNTPDPLGSASRIFLNELNRTFIGSTTTYGQNMNPGNTFPEILFKRQSQRNHFTVGLPSSSVFVHAGESPTTANIEKISNNNSVIVGTLDIKARGEVWTLEYNGDKVNYSDLPSGRPGELGPEGVPPNTGGNKDNGGGIQVFPGGDLYPPPPSVGKVEDPVYIIVDNKYTSRDDLRTEGSH